MPEYRMKPVVPVVVEARQLLNTEESSRELAAWCHGWRKETKPQDKRNQLIIINDGSCVMPGDWIVKTRGGFIVVGVVDFALDYEAAP